MGGSLRRLGRRLWSWAWCNASIHKVNESVRVEEIDALHEMYLRTLKNLLAK